MENILLHSTSLKDFQAIIGQVVEEKLKQFRPDPAPQATGDYLTRREVCDLLKISFATLHYYTKDGTLKGYRIGGRVLYRRDEINDSIRVIQSVKYKHVR